MSLVKQLGWFWLIFVCFLCSHDNEPYTVLKESKQSFCPTKNSLMISLKGKLQKPFDGRRPIFGLLTCWFKYYVVLSWGGFGQLNFDNRSQNVEAIYGSLDFIGPTHTSWKTSNRKWRNCRKIVVALNDSWNKTSTFSCTRVFTRP